MRQLFYSSSHAAMPSISAGQSSVRPRSSGRCPGESLPRACTNENQAPRSTSGKLCITPDFGGHSSENLLLRNRVGSRSPSTAQAVMILPLGCRTGARARKGPFTATPVSSRNSRCAASNASSPCSYSPLGIDQAPSYLRAQYGPPGCTRNISRILCRFRYRTIPALLLLRAADTFD